MSRLPDVAFRRPCLVVGTTGAGKSYNTAEQRVVPVLAAGVAFFFKQWGSWFPDDFFNNIGRRGVMMRPDGTKPAMADLPAIESGTFDYSGYQHFAFMGKKSAGRLLDGRTWDEMPVVGQ